MTNRNVQTYYAKDREVWVQFSDGVHACVCTIASGFMTEMTQVIARALCGPEDIHLEKLRDALAAADAVTKDPEQFTPADVEVFRAARAVVAETQFIRERTDA